MVGVSVGNSVGDVVGDSVGDAVGDSDGDVVGDSVEDVVGNLVGDVVGDSVGVLVGLPVSVFGFGEGAFVAASRIVSPSNGSVSSLSLAAGAVTGGREGPLSWSFTACTPSTTSHLRVNPPSLLKLRLHGSVSLASTRTATIKAKQVTAILIDLRRVRNTIVVCCCVDESMNK